MQIESPEAQFQKTPWMVLPELLAFPQAKGQFKGNVFTWESFFFVFLF